MRAGGANREIEIKLRVASIPDLRRRLRKISARRIIPRTYESNTLYDTSARDLARQGQLIRIRVEQLGTGFTRKGRSKKFILTFKGPIHDKLKNHAKHWKSSPKTRYRIREEAEVYVSGDRIERILAGLGMVPIFRYEKFRTTYALRPFPKLKIECDETPIGDFLELEGPPSAIDRAACLLGYTRHDYITETYGDLYFAECRRQGRKPTDMLFTPAQKSR